jgi:hypothetical protein
MVVQKFIYLLKNGIPLEETRACISSVVERGLNIVKLQKCEFLKLYVGKNWMKKFSRQRKSLSIARGCQMVCFQTKNPNLGKFWRVLQWKMWVYSKDT